MTIEVVRYDPGQRAAWDQLLGQSKNGLFLFQRDYMEYHADRFPDFSAIAYLDGKPVMLCPASLDHDDGIADSHPGLTFGGFVLARGIRSGLKPVCRSMATTPTQPFRPSKPASTLRSPRNAASAATCAAMTG